MKATFTILSCLLFAALNAQEDKIKGTWYTEDKSAKVKLFKATNGKYYGKLVWLKDGPEAKDTKNPDISKRDQPLLNLIFLHDFTYNANEKQWEGGTVYDAESGKTYNCYLWFDGNENKLNLRGYVMGMKMLGRTSYWTHTDE